jgi:hypothetical protein
MTKQYGFMLINKRGNPTLINGQLPIFYLKNIALKEAVKFSATVIKVEISEFKNKVK